MVGKADRNERIDDDILQSRADVLRARDVMPPYKQEPKPEEVNEETTSPGSPTEISPQREETSHEDAKETPAKPASTQQDKGEIPRFDLAEKILAEQRKITTVRRKAPSERKEAEGQRAGGGPIGRAGGQPAGEKSYEEEIVAEIVARDIEKLCGGGSLADSC